MPAGTSTNWEDLITPRATLALIQKWLGLRSEDAGPLRSHSGNSYLWFTQPVLNQRLVYCPLNVVDRTCQRLESIDIVAKIADRDVEIFFTLHHISQCAAGKWIYKASSLHRTRWKDSGGAAILVHDRADQDGDGSEFVCEVRGVVQAEGLHCNTFGTFGVDGPHEVEDACYSIVLGASDDLFSRCFFHCTLDALQVMRRNLTEAGSVSMPCTEGVPYPVISFSRPIIEYIQSFASSGYTRESTIWA
ncbi:hypothetical protein BDN72DRAFT_865458 [Pluteus cervinus]|uniref:Uncharacterized protein n=1 Tax=Pluteus cervinus TaxID=181527 RepID=A0ACD3A0W0_9AGAR|nr:hypothetical protein BDN72DRAFT_865458 [Pluteus cervinus]